jgi:hypothetical protein
VGVTVVVPLPWAAPGAGQKGARRSGLVVWPGAQVGRVLGAMVTPGLFVVPLGAVVGVGGGTVVVTTGSYSWARWSGKWGEFGGTDQVGAVPGCVGHGAVKDETEDQRNGHECCRYQYVTAAAVARLGFNPA